jgi:predicted methyltransferase
MVSLSMTRRRAVAGIFATGTVVACGGPGREVGPSPTNHQALLEWALAGPWRIDPERDSWRHPAETLTFWELRPGMTVLELLPGRGWFTSILAPYLNRSGGRLIVAQPGFTEGGAAAAEVEQAFTQRFSDAELFGQIEQVRLTGQPGQAIAAAGSVDLIVCARNVHTLMAAGIEGPVLAACREALKPGGLFGIEQHRASALGAQDPQARDGYVREAYVQALMQEAGFTYVASSDVNANPLDTRDHPFGVWTLPPVLRTAPLGEPDDPTFDTAPYREIGESDRMTLKFRRPPEDAAPTTPPTGSEDGG